MVSLRICFPTLIKPSWSRLTLKKEELLASKEKQLSELSTLKEAWEKKPEQHAAEIYAQKLDQAEMFLNGFDMALDQVKVLFPDIDLAVLGEADALKES
ncbi:hypothetical protein L195_g030368 [Trifolium pratense]|uniref:Uncharacterized protein n=1 Tax=Trifolium pratense TaxID=57577 RepID=A0A2K3L7D7_TRIPR|nr:hypothetical protein L195_g030368 [Trifolium pratense]